MRSELYGTKIADSNSLPETLQSTVGNILRKSNYKIQFYGLNTAPEKRNYSGIDYKMQTGYE